MWLMCWTEINFVWSFHQVHHTSQEFNLSVGIRLPSLNRYVAMVILTIFMGKYLQAKISYKKDYEMEKLRIMKWHGEKCWFYLYLKLKQIKAYLFSNTEKIN